VKTASVGSAIAEALDAADSVYVDGVRVTELVTVVDPYMRFVEVTVNCGPYAPAIPRRLRGRVEIVRADGVVVRAEEQR